MLPTVAPRHYWKASRCVITYILQGAQISVKLSRVSCIRAVSSSIVQIALILCKVCCHDISGDNQLIARDHLAAERICLVKCLADLLRNTIGRLCNNSHGLNGNVTEQSSCIKTCTACQWCCAMEQDHHIWIKEPISSQPRKQRGECNCEIRCFL
ncbi:hypothetical protein XELAEV_18046616mg [Xenopus laevis]|uniref:Uncharacterized protein n=1 Tax=Xenopus laevis TaxID=8355 RepID=A0A974BTN5_XENLA|nr:hypothetical protein XELAEV_18046616mg [Xenopus laevis]